MISCVPIIIDPSVLKCPPGKPVAACVADPCQVTSCPRHPRATCISDFCGGCNARFFNNKGVEVTSTCGMMNTAIMHCYSACNTIIIIMSLV